MEQTKSTSSNGQIDVLDYRSQSLFTYQINKWYVRFIRPHISQKINQQRLKLIWNVWGYRPILVMSHMSLIDKLRLVSRFILIDWNIVHAHLPAEIAIV